jgi:hypothetical protein
MVVDDEVRTAGYVVCVRIAVHVDEIVSPTAGDGVLAYPPKKMLPRLLPTM